MKLEKAIEAVHSAGLRVYCPKIKDSGFIKIYLKPLSQIMPKVSGNSIKVLLALSAGLEWQEPEIFISVNEIVKLTGLNKETVRLCLDELEKNLIIKRLGPNIRRSYTISTSYLKLGK